MSLLSEILLNTPKKDELTTDPQVVSEYSVTSKTRARKRKTNNDDYVKRPLNSFMIWANEERQKIKKFYPNIRNSGTILKYLGTVWNKMSNDEKKVYNDKAERLRLDHSLTYPDYKYNPKRKKKKRTVKAKPTTEMIIKHNENNRKIEDPTKALPTSSAKDLNENIAQAFPYVIKFEIIFKKNHCNLKNQKLSTENKNSTNFNNSYMDNSFPTNAELQLGTHPALETANNEESVFGVGGILTDSEVDDTIKLPSEVMNILGFDNLEMKTFKYGEYMNTTDASVVEDVDMCGDTDFDLSSIDTDDLLRIPPDAGLDDFSGITPRSDFSSYLDFSWDLEMSDILSDMGISEDWI